MAGFQDRAYVAGRFALTIDGQVGGFLKKVSGGEIKAEVVKEPAGPTNITYKNIGPISYTDFTFDVGMAMSPGFYDWIRQSWRKEYIRKNGAVVACNFNYESMSTREFFEGLITKTTIPAMDGSSKDPCYMSITVAPEIIRYKPGDKSKVDGQFGKGQQKKWLPSNFKFELGDLPTDRVNKVDSFSVEQKTVTDDVGSKRDYQKEPASVTYPDLTVTIAQVDAQPWYDWFEDFVIRGNCGQEAEKNGRLVFMTPNQETELGHVDFKQVGIFSINDAESSAGGESVKRVTIKLYVEEMDFVYGGEVIG